MSDRLAALRARLRQSLHLTRGERLMMDRRQRRITQAEMAALYGVSLDMYRGWELDIGDVPWLSGVRVGDLSLRQLCWVHRRRRGITLEEIAEALGKSVSWVHNAEHGRSGAEQVVDYVLERGAAR